MKRISHTAGFSMIEVLITLVITAVGLLGVIALQALSKKNNVDVIQQTIASQLAQDLLDMMRANNSPTALLTYYENAPNRKEIPANPPADCASAPCTPAQLALYDLWAWNRDLQGLDETLDGSAVGGLVNPTACLDGPVVGGAGAYTLTIAWRSPSELKANTAVSCGAGQNKYGDGDEFRRTLSVTAFIDAS